MNTESFKAVVRQMEERGIGFEDGLSDTEIETIQNKFGFVFPDDLSLFLQTGLPVSEPWESGRTHANPFPNWRSGDENSLWQSLGWPYEGMCFDIQHNRFWMPVWGKRPESYEEACAIAREHVNQAPTLIPIYGHRYMPDAPRDHGNPVYSVWQTDIIYYGLDLADYLAQEFTIDNPFPPRPKPKRIDFWSSLPDMWIPEWN